jgi:hypothetical protein
MNAVAINKTTMELIVSRFRAIIITQLIKLKSINEHYQTQNKSTEKSLF